MHVACVNKIPLEINFAFKSFPPFPAQILVILLRLFNIMHSYIVL